MSAIYQPRVTYTDLDRLLADPLLEAVIIATSDAFHVPLATKALAAGKHVFVEKPLGLEVGECEELGSLAAESGLVFQVGFNRRFDPALAFAVRFIHEEMGPPVVLNAWYCDSVFRYTMTDNLQPIPVLSANARKPAEDPKSDKRRYFLLTHGSHLFDSARFLGGPIAAVQARFQESAGSFIWSIAADFVSGCFGHLTLIIPARGDFEEGFQLFGDSGSVQGKLNLPWYRKAGAIECFSAKEGVYRRPLGADADTYKLQLEGFADTILNSLPQQGATVSDGIENLRALVAVARSVETGRQIRLDEVSGHV
jgi:predicted dehydrogenase